MSERIVVEFNHVGKMYRLYNSRWQSLLDATSLGYFVPKWNSKLNNFWALRNVSFRLNAGSRLGIIGRNGAGKTTLLKLMTGNLTPTEGKITVRGDVQALLEAGAGFHPEFSGYENIEASLIQSGFSRAQIKAAVDEIADFTELGDFLDQPFKTYSAGMQARLVFTTATAVQPDILIIDEILGAGDAYFAAKSRTRMRELVEGGASVLLVSHALDQILQFCDESIWLERGRIVLRGPTMEVVKAYEEFVHNLQDRQLKAANRQRKLGFRDAVEVGHFADNFVVALSLTGSPGVRVDITTVELLCENVAEEILRVGDPQDTDQTHLSYLAIGSNSWGEPQNQVSGGFRSLTLNGDGPDRPLGEMVFRSYMLEPGKQYAFRIKYRTIGDTRLTLTVSQNGRALVLDAPLAATDDWKQRDVLLPLAPAQDPRPTVTAEKEAKTAAEVLSAEPIVAVAESEADDSGLQLTGEAVRYVESIEARAQLFAAAGPLADDFGSVGTSGEEAFAISTDRNNKAFVANSAGAEEPPAETEAVDTNPADRQLNIRRWSGEGSLLIEDVNIEDAHGEERAVFRVADPMILRLKYRATRTGSFPVIYSVVIFRTDGVRVTQHVSPLDVLKVSARQPGEVKLEFPSMDLADGRYVISVALHRELDPQFPNDTVRYDLIDRSYEFEIVGNPPLRTSLFVLPSQWKL